MKITISELISDNLKDCEPLLDSILPGGERWCEVDDCLTSCPYYDKCEDWGPSKKLCSTEWRRANADVDAVRVIRHVLSNFDYYDRSDFDGPAGRLVSKLLTVFDVPDQIEGELETLALVKVRLAQAKFKSNLFRVWGGCSLEKISVPDQNLIASHILPWSRCMKDEDKTSGFNGFLLPPNYDYVFDKFLVTFDSGGRIETLDTEPMKQLYQVLGIDPNAQIKLHPENKPFLEFHREVFDAKRCHHLRT